MFGNGFYNPYTYQPYYQTANATRNLGGLFNTANVSSGVSKAAGLAGLFKKFNFSGFLNGASKTLNVVNQAIPVYYQVKPIFSNAKTMFRIMNAVKDDDSSKKTTTNEIKTNTINRNTSMNNNLVEKFNQTYTTYQTNEDLSENPVFFI